MKRNITYEIKGAVERSCVFKINRAHIRLNFEGGSISSRGIIPAQYSTDKEIIQNAIESSPLYKSGVISKGDVYETEEESDEEVTATDTASGCDYPEVINMQKAKEILMAEPYNVSLADLQNKEAVIAKAAKLGITFSNWK